MKSDAYRLGYSLESLRDLELVRLTTEESRNGYFLDESLKLLFRLVHEGWPKGGPQQTTLTAQGRSDYHTFTLPALQSHLFDPERTELLNKVKFRNHVLQRVIELLSLSDPSRRKGRGRRGRNARRGRISYAQLGINQLGSVYEALLSYRGFFAETDLYEVKKAGEDPDELDTAYFVPADEIANYTDDEKVFDEQGNPRRYPKGTFIYRLAGRDREKSASYYTPEVLTRCLVKYALKELLEGKTADEILEITVCEPAMGSAAFLNEAVNQLAEAYLERKQRELGETIPHERYAEEKQKVKMYLADNNVFGVDLNPVAVELAEVSLWLNSLYPGAHVPWFGMQLVCGNSLVGARRQVFPSASLMAHTADGRLWLDRVPERVPPGKPRPADAVYHFLLPDRGMADYGNKVVKGLVPEHIEQIRQWKKAFVKPLQDHEAELVLELSAAVDRLWQAHTDDLRKYRADTTDPMPVYGRPDPEGRRTSTRHKDTRYEQEVLSRRSGPSTPYRRLKLAMDYWCALWFWPIEKAHLLPTRSEFLLELSLVLQGTFSPAAGAAGTQLGLFGPDRPEQLPLDLRDELGAVDVDDLCRKYERLRLVAELAERYRFLHWELEFADLFADRGGFDLVLGNPPWIKVEWNEGAVLGDAEPLYVLRKFTASRLAELRDDTLQKKGLLPAYLAAYEEAEATQNFLNALQNYPLLKGVQTNLYKCFLPQAWMIG
ncbi:MAG: hypothetical protein D6708_03600, partial [Candidatus Dadabacteria bacterium]